MSGATTQPRPFGVGKWGTGPWGTEFGQLVGVGAVGQINFAGAFTATKIGVGGAVGGLLFSGRAELVLTWQPVGPCEAGAWSGTVCEIGTWTPASGALPGTWSNAA